MSLVDPESVSALLKEAAQMFILPRVDALKEDEISTKTGPMDLVTAADIEAEAYLTDALPKVLSGSVVIGEEAVSKDQQLLEQLQSVDQPIWIVDPVDGTRNFVLGNERFGMMVALVDRGETVMSWVYHIPGDEMVISEQGAGAFSDGVRLQIVAGHKPFEQMRGFVGTRYFPPHQQSAMEEVCARFGNTESAGCAAYEYLQVAKGLKDFAVYRRLKPWDHVPGSLMVQEAGGVVMKWDGEALAPVPGQIGIIAAHNQHNWVEVYQTLLQEPLSLPDVLFAFD